MIELSTTALPSGIKAISLLPWIIGTTRICTHGNDAQPPSNKPSDDRLQKGLSAYESGIDGELVAVDFLEQKGFRILSRRFRTRVGEIDIIARKGELIVFAEVKTSTKPANELADRITRVGVHRTRRAAITWITRFPRDQYGVRHYRFDAILVTTGSNEVNPEIDHIKNAF